MELHVFCGRAMDARTQATNELAIAFDISMDSILFLKTRERKEPLLASRGAV
jgi:hypothetical protein